MNQKILDKIKTLPEDIQPLMISLMGSVANGLLDNAEAVLVDVLDGKAESAWEKMLGSLSVKDLTDLLETVNNNMQQITKDYTDSVIVERQLMYKLIVFAMGFLRSEVMDAIEST